jgi:DNA-binding IclR family transcriptional regulator
VSTVGSRLPLHCTGVGKVLLAFAPEAVQREVLAAPLRRVTRHTVTSPGRLAEQLRRVRAEGYASTVEEMSLGACSVAVPVHGEDRVVGAVGIVVPNLRRDRPRLVAALQVAARGIERSLGG